MRWNSMQGNSMKCERQYHGTPHQTTSHHVIPYCISLLVWHHQSWAMYFQCHHIPSLSTRYYSYLLDLWDGSNVMDRHVWTYQRNVSRYRSNECCPSISLSGCLTPCLTPCLSICQCISLSECLPLNLYVCMRVYVCYLYLCACVSHVSFSRPVLSSIHLSAILPAYFFSKSLISTSNYSHGTFYDILNNV